MANKITVKFEAQGARALKGAIDQLAVAQTRLNDGTKKAELLQKKLNKELDKYGKSGAPLATRNTRLLDNAFATLRSKLLLASFGFSLVAGSIGKTLKAFGEQEKAILKLNNALGFNSELLQQQASQLQNLTGIGDEVIISSQSILASFVRNEEAVSGLTKTTLDLSVALGIRSASLDTLFFFTFLGFSFLRAFLPKDFKPIKGLIAKSNIPNLLNNLGAKVLAPIA